MLSVAGEVAAPGIGCLGSSDSEPPAIPRRLLAHPGGVALSTLNLPAPLPTLLSIGPEGGLTDAEVAAAVASGWQQVSLGASILRVETAAIALAATIAAASSQST